MVKKAFLGLFVTVITCGGPVFAAGRKAVEPSVELKNAITTLDREASVNAESSLLVAYLIQKEYGTREEELRWALGQKLNWGTITALAYIQATTGKSFAEMSHDNAPRDFWSYAENAGMNGAKMSHSLNGFLKRVERERNSQIFDKLRASRKVYPLPDLGSGFGLFQEALDFRSIDSQHPIKIENIPEELGKGGK